MLNKEYDDGIIGLNYLSLVKGILLQKSNRKSLILDDPKLVFADSWCSHIGWMEKEFLKKIGRYNNITPLIEIEDYLEQTNTILFLDDNFIEFSSSPLVNINELARKIPASLSTNVIKQLKDLDVDDFNQELESYLHSIIEDYFVNRGQFDIELSFTKKFANINKIFDSFITYLNQDTLETKQVHYILQVMFQTVFSSARSSLESKYLFLSLITPRFVIDQKRLKEDLLFYYRKIGGDIKSTSVVDWGLEDKKLRFLLVSSVDGLIKVDHSYYYSQLNYNSGFHNRNERTKFLTIKLECQLSHEYIKLYQRKRIIFSNKERMGSDFPFWQIYIDENNILHGWYTYVDTLGTKPSFYHHQAAEDIYDSIKNIAPSLSRNEWLSNISFSRGSDVWVEFAADEKAYLHPNHEFLISKLYSKDSKTPIDSLSYCGPDRAKSLGSFGYLLDIFS